jgi:hypothetical protein
VSECVAAALVVSKSVDDARFRLQMEGIAEALEDPSVFSAITGNAGGILIAMVIWADRPNLTMGWLRIASPANAAAAAGHAAAGGRIPLPRPDVPDILGRGSAGAAERVVIDVSADGIDNCTDAGGLAEAHAALLASGPTVNGLPILVRGKNDVVGAGAYRAPGYGLLPARRCRRSARARSNGTAPTSSAVPGRSFSRRPALATSRGRCGRNS